MDADVFNVERSLELFLPKTFLLIRTGENLLPPITPVHKLRHWTRRANAVKAKPAASSHGQRPKLLCVRNPIYVKDMLIV